MVNSDQDDYKSWGEHNFRHAAGPDANHWFWGYTGTLSLASTWKIPIKI